jgi:hypothetical protein
MIVGKVNKYCTSLVSEKGSRRRGVQSKPHATQMGLSSQTFDPFEDFEPGRLHRILLEITKVSL